MTHDDALPALPHPTIGMASPTDHGRWVHYYTAEQMRAYARQAVALWKLSAMAQEDERAALAARAEPSRCPHIRSSGTGEWATNWCALNPPALPSKLWLWRNHVDGRPEYWAFDNPYPVRPDGGDPLTLGEPCGYAIVKPSRSGRAQWDEAEVLRRIAASRPEKR